MEQYLHQVNSSGITTIDYWGDPKTINNENDHWLEVKIQSRQEVVNELKEFQFDSGFDGNDGHRRIMAV